MASKKLVFLAATLAALVVLTQATITITTEVDTEYDMGQCRPQLRGQWPDECEQYMKQQGMSRRGGRFDDIDRQGSGGRQFDKCCDELEMMQPQCQCEAMRMMMKEMMGMGGSQMIEKVMELPMRCGTMQRRCHISGRM